MNRVDVIAIHTEAQVNFDPPNQDIIVDQLTESDPHRLHGQVEGSDQGKQVHRVLVVAPHPALSFHARVGMPAVY